MNKSKTYKLDPLSFHLRATPMYSFLLFLFVFIIYRKTPLHNNDMVVFIVGGMLAFIFSIPRLFVSLTLTTDKIIEGNKFYKFIDFGYDEIMDIDIYGVTFKHKNRKIILRLSEFSNYHEILNSIYYKIHYKKKVIIDKRVLKIIENYKKAHGISINTLK
jgi:hypothetical protein